MFSLEEKLHQNFGYSTFRFPQKEIIESLLAKRKVLAVLPTGAGKSICYQLPALLLPHTSLVISPLLSLMQDQVSTLQKKNISAAAWNSDTSPDDQAQIERKMRDGQIKLLYFSPERFCHPHMQRLLSSIPISSICIDEAHCIDQWGHDFRPEYLGMAPLVKQLQEQHQCGLAALTATAPPRTVKLIQERFLERSGTQYCLPYVRNNLRYSVYFPRSEQEKRRMLLAWVRWWKHQGSGSFLAYAATRLETEWYARWLTQQGYPAQAFHAGLSREKKALLVQDFLRKPTLYVTTSAFGMGIDKPDVRYVLHLAPPLAVEAYAQESGRAGRDGQPAECCLLFRPEDLDRSATFATSQSTPEQKKRIQNNVYQMYCFATSRRCLSRFFLRYFWLPEMKWPQGMQCRCSNCAPTLPWQK